MKIFCILILNYLILVHMIFSQEMHNYCLPPKIFLKREVIIDDARSSLTKNTRYMLAEVAMYHASKFLKFHLVPQTTIGYGKNAHGQEVVYCCSVWIEPLVINIAGSEHLKSLITEQEWAQMNIFYFLFGQYDRHFGNLIISRETGKLYLIDNEAVANIQQYIFEYSADKKLSCPWVGGVGDFIAQESYCTDEPDDFITLLHTAQPAKRIHQAFPDVDGPTKNDINHGHCRIWHKMLWRQFYIFEDIAAPFSEVISPEILHKIKSLSAQDLISFWPTIPFEVSKETQQQYENLIQQFVTKTLERRDMIVAYFMQHPEKVRELK